MYKISGFFICIFILVACTSNKDKIRFTFSQEFDVDFMSSEGRASVLYDNSKPIDTLFSYSGAHQIGKDSIIYVRIRKSTDLLSQENDFYFGDCVGLFLYDGTKINRFNLPYFNAMFSSFVVHNKMIYYWGHSTDGTSTYAVKYNLSTKEVIKRTLDLKIGTDYYAYFNVPRIAGNMVYFETESSNQVFDTETMNSVILNN